MKDPINSITNDKPVNPLDKWVAAFEEAYALEDENTNDLLLQEPGLLRKPSGEAVQITRITQDMLKKDPKLARAVLDMAAHGLLGFISHAGSTSGKIEFRQDIAEKIGKRSVEVVNLYHPDATEPLNAEIGSLDDAAYALLAGVTLLLEEQSEVKKEETEKKKEASSAGKSSNAVRPSAVPASQQKLVNPQHNIVKKLALNILKDLRVNEKQRTKKAADEADKEKRILSQEIKRDVINHEIKNREIQHSDDNRAQIKATDEIKRQNTGRPKK